MSDTNYVNTYVNLAVESLHANLNEMLQLRTQIKLNEGLISERDQALASIQNEKDAVISSLQQEIERLRQEQASAQNISVEMQTLRDNAAVWETNYNNMLNKVSHMDTLTNQFNDLKRQFIEKEQALAELNQNFVKANNDLVLSAQELADAKLQIETLNNEIESLQKKIDKLVKKEEKAPTPISAPLPKKGINKEDTKPSIPAKPNVMKVEEPKEIDDF